LHISHVKNINKNGLFGFDIAYFPYIGGNPCGVREIARIDHFLCINDCMVMHYGWGYGIGGTHERARGATSHDPTPPH
jgi:hypothetical protein